MTAVFVAMIFGAYLLGSVPAAYLVARWRRGIDLRQYGSGNVGAANVLAAVSKRWSIPVTIFDIGKGALTVWIAQLLEFSPAQQVTVGIFTIIGHNWPVFLRFRGGRGVFASLGVITMLAPKVGLIMFVLPYLLAPIRQVSLGVFFALFVLPFLGWFLSEPLGIEQRVPLTIGFIIISLIMVIRRLAVPRTKLSESVHPAELVINRILFDRDIRDRKAWVSQNRTEIDSIEQPLEQEQGKT